MPPAPVGRCISGTSHVANRRTSSICFVVDGKQISNRLMIAIGGIGPNACHRPRFIAANVCVDIDVLFLQEFFPLFFFFGRSPRGLFRMQMKIGVGVLPIFISSELGWGFGWEFQLEIGRSPHF